MFPSERIQLMLFVLSPLISTGFKLPLPSGPESGCHSTDLTLIINLGHTLTLTWFCVFQESVHTTVELVGKPTPRVTYSSRTSAVATVETWSTTTLTRVTVRFHLDLSLSGKHMVVLVLNLFAFLYLLLNFRLSP